MKAKGDRYQLKLKTYYKFYASGIIVRVISASIE